MKKKFIEVPFLFEMAMKIQNGEVKGKIETREGNPAKILDYRLKNTPNDMIVVIKNKNGVESVNNYYDNGMLFDQKAPFRADLLLYLEDEEKAPQHEFKPFEKVLVRDNEREIWNPDIFCKHEPEREFEFVCFKECWKQCIPYEGNEHLLGTTEEPKEEQR